LKVKYQWTDHYTHPNYWDSRTPLYIGMPQIFQLYHDLNDKKARVFLKTLKGKILDIGCGDGRFTSYADVGVDFSKGMLRKAKAHHQNRNFVQASILCLPFKDGSFSSAFTFDVLLHIPSDKRKIAINEIDRIASQSYNFLTEHRTVMPFILQPLETIPIRWVFWLIVPYIVILLSFPFDRLRKLKIESASQIFKKLEN